VQKAETLRANTEEGRLGYGKALDAFDKHLLNFIPTKMQEKQMLEDGSLDTIEPVPFKFSGDDMGVATRMKTRTPTREEATKKQIPRDVDFIRPDGSQGRLTVLGPPWTYEDDAVMYPWFIRNLDENGKPGKDIINRGILTLGQYKKTMSDVAPVTDLQQRLIGLKEGTYEEATDLMIRNLLRRNRNKDWTYEEALDAINRYVAAGLKAWTRGPSEDRAAQWETSGSYLARRSGTV
jgi:hypothetical protein